MRLVTQLAELYVTNHSRPDNFSKHDQLLYTYTMYGALQKVCSASDSYKTFMASVLTEFSVLAEFGIHLTCVHTCMDAEPWNMDSS